MLMTIATPIPRADFEPAPAPPVTVPLADRFGRTISYVRVSVTDRCDMRCVYCMSEDMNFLPKRDLLTLEELDRLCTALIGRGVRKLRMTGGEPLVRRNIMLLFHALGRHIEFGRARRIDPHDKRVPARAARKGTRASRRAPSQRVARYARPGEI